MDRGFFVDSGNIFEKAIMYNAVTYMEINVNQDKIISFPYQIGPDGNWGNLFDIIGTQPIEKYSDFVTFFTSHMSDPQVVREYKSFFDLDALKEAYDNGELEKNFDTWVYDPQGRKRLCRYSFMLGQDPVSHDIIAISIAKDVTDDEHRAKQVEIALEKSRNANADRMKFMVNMAHELKTPLNAIQGSADLILKNINDIANVEMYSRLIKDSAKQLLNVLNESLEISAVSSGQAVTVKEECDLMQLLNDVEKHIYPAVLKKHIRFFVDNGMLDNYMVYADYLKVKRILNEVLDNAARYTPEGGNITVVLAVEPSEVDKCTRFVFTVEDTGCGMSEELKQHMFDMFEKDTADAQSSGLGLPLVRKMVDLIGGDLNIESEVGKGTKVIIGLNLQEIADATDDSFAFDVDDVTTDVSLEGKRILLVEDNSINLRIEKELFNSVGIEVDTATNGQKALEKVEACADNPYDIIIMDLEMPVMNGYEAAESIRALVDERVKHIPIIAVSANSFSEDRNKAIGCGMQEHYPKPIDIFKLCDLMELCLRKVARKEYDNI